MNVAQIGNFSPGQTQAGQSGSSPENSKLGKQEFLNLLVTQLRHQNPLEPLKQEEYAAQLAQFSSLEQLSNLNDRFDQMYQSNQQLNQSITNALSATLIGKRVRGVGNTLIYDAGRNNQIHYRLGTTADSVTVQIKDSVGNVVKTQSLGPQEAGDHSWTWNGRLDTNAAAADGEHYTYEITGTTEDGQTISGQPFIDGKITGVQYTGQGNMSFLVGDLRVSTGEVEKIYTDEE